MELRLEDFKLGGLSVFVRDSVIKYSASRLMSDFYHSDCEFIHVVFKIERLKWIIRREYIQ